MTKANYWHKSLFAAVNLEISFISFTFGGNLILNKSCTFVFDEIKVV